MEQDREPPHPAHWQVGEIIHLLIAVEIITAGRPLYGVDLSIQLSVSHAQSEFEKDKLTLIYSGFQEEDQIQVSKDKLAKI